MKVRIGILVNLSFFWVLANLPASLLRNVINSDHVSLIAPQGTVWHGSARFVTALDIDARIRWQVTLWRPGLDLSISDENSQLGGRIEFGTAVQASLVTGELSTLARSVAAALRPLLARGVHAERHDFSVALWCCSNGKALPNRVERRRPAHSGQPAIRGIYAAATSHLGYQRSRRTRDTGYSRWTEGWAADGSTLEKNGSVYFGVSRGMLRLANYPWSGSESEETLIFEVERRLTHSASPFARTALAFRSQAITIIN